MFTNYELPTVLLKLEKQVPHHLTASVHQLETKYWLSIAHHHLLPARTASEFQFASKKNLSASHRNMLSFALVSCLLLATSVQSSEVPTITSSRNHKVAAAEQTTIGRFVKINTL